MVDECKKRWKSLRDTCRKERRKEAEKKRSGAGASQSRPWRYGGTMSFLNPFLEERVTASNMVGGVGEALTPLEREDWARQSQGTSSPHTLTHTHTQSLLSADQNSESQQDETQLENRIHTGHSSPSCSAIMENTVEGQTGGIEGNKRKRRRAQESEEKKEFEERMLTALEAVSRRSVTPPEDSDSLLFKSLLEDFRTLPVQIRQDLKFQIHKMVYEAKCQEAGHTGHWGESNGVLLTSL